VAKTELSSFEKLYSLFSGISVALFIHIFVTLFILAKFVGKFNLYKFIFKIRKALVVALTTASSTATLPVSTEVLKTQVGVKSKTAGFMLPLGATLNMDGSALYQSLVIIFLANFAGIDLNFYQQFLVFFFVMTSSAGTAGIPAGGVMMVGAVMGMIGIPMEYIGVYLLIDRFWDYPITMVNVLGDLVGAKIVDRYIK
jgi:Na+/H+-dicarboxylate symporter